MAGDWIKMRTRLCDERAVMTICDQTGLDEFGVIGRLHCVWAWAGEHTIDGVILDVTIKTVDRITRHPGFAAAMIAARWLEETPSGIIIPRWDSYNSRAAKERAQAAKRQADKRWRDKKTSDESAADVTESSRSASRHTVTSHDARGEERRGDERREENSNRDRTDRRRTAPVDQSPLDDSDSGGGDDSPLDLSAVDWDCVIRWSEALGKRVPPFTDKDRRQWFKFAVMAQVMFSEHWLLDSAEAVVNAKSRSKKNRQAHLVAVLKCKAAEQHVDASTFLGILRRIEIPADVWKSDSIRVKK